MFRHPPYGAVLQNFKISIRIDISRVINDQRTYFCIIKTCPNHLSRLNCSIAMPFFIRTTLSNASSSSRFSTKNYRTFIEELLTSSGDSDTIEVATSDAYLFMHDNSPCHTASKVTNYLKQRRFRTMKMAGSIVRFKSYRKSLDNVQRRLSQAISSRGY
jgi:hypothetical protein